MRPVFHYQPLAFALQLLFQHALPTLANTEIINFIAGNPITVPPLQLQNWRGHSFAWLTPYLLLTVALHVICRTVLHAGANEIIVRDRIPAPLLDAGAPPSDPLCDNEQDAMNLLRGSSKLPHCPHDLWVLLDLDGDEWYGHNGVLALWKNYDRFTLRVSWPASVSP